MAETESNKEEVTQAVIQAATSILMAFRDIDTGPQSAPAQNQGEPQRKRHGGPVLEQFSFKTNVQDR